MASTFFASTPISRRNRRRQQKLRKTSRYTEATQQRTLDYAEGRPQSWEDTGSANDHLLVFDPNTDGHDLNAAFSPQRPQNSNPFSLLDVSIPSPTLSVLSARQNPLGWDFPTHQHDLHSIERSSISNLPASHKRRDRGTQLREDKWALSLQKSTAVIRSEGPKKRACAVSPPVETPFPTSPKKHAPSITDVLPTVQNEEHVVRIPSPLLYHKRSQGASSEPMNSQLADFTPPSPSIDRYAIRQIEPLSQARKAGQQQQAPSTNNDTAPRFVAARLPFMGDIPPYNWPEVKDVSVKPGVFPKLGNDYTLSAVARTSPILTTTNMYIFPKRVYNAYQQPDAAWSAPSYMDTCCSWKSSRVLRFPKLSIPGYKVSSKSSPVSSDTDSSNLIVRYQQIPSVGRDSLWLKTSLPAPLPQIFDSRCRSSTQDSFDSKFNVLTATKQIEPPAIESVIMQQPTDCSNSTQSLFDNVLEKVSVSTTESPAEEKSLAGDSMEWSHDACNLQCTDESSNLEGITTCCDEGYDMVSETDEHLTTLDMSAHDESSCKRSEDVWFDYHALYDCVNDNAGSEVHVDEDDLEADNVDWAWDNHDDWETIASTPATELESPSGLNVDEQAW